ncbi:porin family protein [Chitinophagaceae bacterium 26-R-25]|nr:porin family protein [Chitinophagaceae bacterium 26-R-25]
MKKISLLLLAAITLGHLNVKAQTIDIGAKGGISIPNLTAGGSDQNPLNTGYSSRLGPDFAVFAEFHFSKLFSLQPQIEYSSQGGKKDGLQAFPVPAELQPMFPPGQVPPYLYANFKSEAKLNYVMIPILAKFGWDLGKSSAWRLYVDAGPFVAFCVSAKQVTSGSSEVYADPSGQNALPVGTQSFDNTQDIKDQLHNANFGIEGNVGIAYKIHRSSIFIEGGGNYGFINIQKGSANGKNNTGAGCVTIGYAYTLKHS